MCQLLLASGPLTMRRLDHSTLRQTGQKGLPGASAGDGTRSDRVSSASDEALSGETLASASSSGGRAPPMDACTCSSCSELVWQQRAWQQITCPHSHACLDTIQTQRAGLRTAAPRPVITQSPFSLLGVNRSARSGGVPLKGLSACAPHGVAAEDRSGARRECAALGELHAQPVLSHCVAQSLAHTRQMCDTQPGQSAQQASA